MMGSGESHEGLSSTNWTLGWKYPLQKSFACAITPDKPTTSTLSIMMDGFFKQVSRVLAGGATGPEALTLLLMLLSNHFDRTDGGLATVRCIILACLTGAPFSNLAGSFEMWCQHRRRVTVVWDRERRLLWRWFGW